MLSFLRVKNLALVDNARVEFGPGLNVITGETGAGKSILVGALGLVLGERADRTLLRTGEDQCLAEAVFEGADGPGLRAAFEEAGLEAPAGGQVIVRRVIRANGSGQNLVNDQPVTLAVLKRLGELLVDLHGPHDHQSLFRPDFQLEVLDAFGRHGEARQAYARTYAERTGLERRRAGLEDGGEGVAEQIDLLSHRVREIEEANLDPAEEEALRREHLTLGNAQTIRELGGAVAQALMEGEPGAFECLAAAQRALEDLARVFPEAEPWREELRQVSARVQELHTTAAGRLEGIEADPGRLQWLDERLAVYERLKRRYGPDLAAVGQTLERARERLADLGSRGERLAEVARLLAETGERLDREGAALRRGRAAAAGRLGQAITREIRSVGFEHGAFAVEVRDGGVRPSGLDEVEFGFAPNAGETMRPLRAIASSGEISRVMLATKIVLAALDRIPVLVFDEIDANVGGRMAAVVGRKLAALAAHHQVLCITHLPPVAVHGTVHLAVSKRVEGGRTFTEVRRLEGEARVEEIARMLGGRDLTRVTLQHARELLAARG